MLVDKYLKFIAEGLAKAYRGRFAPTVMLTLNSSGSFYFKWFRLLLVNLEHTLVLPGGRDSEGAASGRVASPRHKSEKYLVRLPLNRKMFEAANSIVEYSQSNIDNVLSSPLADVYSGKVVYIAPLLRKELHIKPNNRDISSVHTMMNLTGLDDRRARISGELAVRSGLHIKNLIGLDSDIYSRLDRVGVMLNLHQTDHHHTLEELRILPALMSGVLVVSEPSPLVDSVPFGRFIRFSEVRDMPDLLINLMGNFAAEWDRTFIHGGFSKAVAEMESMNAKNFALLASRIQMGKQR